MRAERDDAIARLECAHDRRGFVTEAGDLYRAPRDARRLAFDQPDARSLAGIEERTYRYLQLRSGQAVRDVDRDGPAKRCGCQPALPHVPSPERPRVREGGI